jgi:hypothetical protein
MVTEYRYYDYMVNMYGSNKVLSERLCAVYGNYTWEEKTSSVRTWVETYLSNYTTVKNIFLKFLALLEDKLSKRSKDRTYNMQASDKSISVCLESAGRLGYEISISIKYDNNILVCGSSPKGRVQELFGWSFTPEEREERFWSKMEELIKGAEEA